MNFCGLWMTHLGDMEKPAPVPLTGVGVHLRIVDLVAEVNIEQIYENKESQPIETTYIFPLDEGAVVRQFTADIDGREIAGRVVKETSAFRSLKPDVFTAVLGNLAAGMRAKIHLTYKTELKVVNGEICFFLPTTIAPIYVPVEDKSSATATSASANHTGISVYELKVEAVIAMASAIIGIRSPTHHISSSIFNDGMKATVVLTGIASPMDRNLVLYVKVAKPYKGCLALQVGRIREAMQMLDASVTSTNLPSAPEESNREPYMNGAIDMLKQLIDELPPLAELNKEILFEAELLLKEERESDDQLKTQFKDRWNRIPSHTLTKVFAQNITTFKAIIGSASAADMIIRTKFETQLGDLDFQMIQQIKDSAHAVAMTLCHNLEEGFNFYNDLSQLLLALQSKISSFCLDRKAEKEKLLKVLSSSPSSGAVHRDGQKTTNPLGSNSTHTGKTSVPPASSTRSSSFPAEKEKLLKDLSSLFSSGAAHQVIQKATNPPGFNSINTGKTSVPPPPPLPATRSPTKILIPVQQKSNAKWNETFQKDIKLARTNGLSSRLKSSVAADS